MLKRAESANVIDVMAGSAYRDSDYRDVEGEQPLGDIRFMRLLGVDRWAALPEAVRRRFSKRLKSGGVALYAGYLAEARFSKWGRGLAQIMRLIGAPLPLYDNIGAVATVSVAEDLPSGGQIWSRSYHHENGLPQTIHSVKSFAGPTGIQEYIGYGLGMALEVEPIANGLAFLSDRFFLKIGSEQIYLPRWLVPLKLRVCHADLGKDTADRAMFDFSLKLEAPLLGELIYQRARFFDH